MMTRYAFPVLFCLIFALAGDAQGEVTQYFDASGSLTPARTKRPALPMRKKHIYSLPEGLELRRDAAYEFYPVFGKTFAEIVKSADENGPLDRKTRKRHPSAFAWSLGWTYEFSFSTEYDEENDKIHCDIVIHDVTLSYDITITLPALTDDSALNRIEKELWKNYVARLLETEHGRAKIVKDDMKEILLQQMGEVSYLMLEADLADTAEKAVERYVRDETARIGKEAVLQIRQKLEQYHKEFESKPTLQPVPPLTGERE
jgi:predicted secreted Zn-dependent protease